MYEDEKEGGSLSLLIALFDELSQHKSKRTLKVDTSLINPSILSLILKEKIRKRIHLITDDEVSRVVGSGKGMIVKKLPALVVTDKENIIDIHYMEDIFLDELDVAISDF